MDNQQRKFYRYIILLMVVLSVSFSLYQYVIKENFYIYAHVSCDPTSEKCFTISCEEEDCEPFSYKVIIQKASTISTCDAWNGGCTELSCREGEAECQTIYCTDENINTYEPFAICTDYE